MKELKRLQDEFGRAVAAVEVRPPPGRPVAAPAPAVAGQPVRAWRAAERP